MKPKTSGVCLSKRCDPRQSSSLSWLYTPAPEERAGEGGTEAELDGRAAKLDQNWDSATASLLSSSASSEF